MHITVKSAAESPCEIAEFTCLSWHRLVYLNLHSKTWKEKVDHEFWERCFMEKQGSGLGSSSHTLEGRNNLIIQLLNILLHRF